MAEELDIGTAIDDLEGDPFGTGEADPFLTGETDQDTRTGATEDDTQSLIDPATLPDELKPHWSRMTQAHGKRLSEFKEREQGLNELERKAEIIDRLYSDPVYARQVVQQMATQLGMSLGATGAEPKPSAGDSQVPANVLQAAQAALSDTPDMQFLAPAIAKVAHAIAQQSVQPFQEQQEQIQQRQRKSEVDEMSAALTESSPGWEEHEDAMLSRLNFLKDALNGRGPMTHPRFGSVLEMLFRLETGNATATAEAGRRMQRALTNRTGASTATRTPVPNVQEQIGKAETPDAQWAIAFRAALAEAQQ